MRYQQKIAGIFLLALLISGCNGSSALKIADVVFADDNLKQCVVDTKALFVDELTSLSCGSRSITSVSGLEELTALTTLVLYNNQLTAVDLTQNTELTQLQLANNQLTAIDVTQNTKLTQLQLDNDVVCTGDVCP